MQLLIMTITITVLVIISILLVITIFRLKSTVQLDERKATMLELENQQQIYRINQLQMELNHYRQANTELQTTINDLTARCSKAEARAVAADRLEELLNEKNELLTEKERQLVELQVSLQAEQKAFAEKLVLLTEARDNLLNSFKALSAEALQNSSQSFLELAKATLEQYQQSAKSDLEGRQQAISEQLLPIKEALIKAEEQVRELEKERQVAYAQLKTHIEMLNNSHQGLQKQTANLVQALRLPQVRGRWGEMQLQRVVELAGMVPHCDFIEQETVSSRLRPDMIINLPGGRRVPVDAKAPLSAYLNALEAENEKDKVRYLQEHVRQIKTHINNLASKSYWESVVEAPDFVVLFLPGEVFFATALEQDPGLIEYGVNQKVILATPTTLIALLKGVAYGWRQEQLAQNAQQIYELGRTLYDRIRILTRHFAELGRNLDKSILSYNRAIGSLERNVLTSARRFKELGAVADGQITILEPIETSTRPLVASEMLTGEQVEHEGDVDG